MTIPNSTFLHDASARGLLLVSGKDRVDLLQRITTNDLKKLASGSGNLCCFTTAKGRVIDRCRMLVGQDAILVVTSAGRSPAVAQWIDRYVIIEDVKVVDLSAAVFQLDVVGEGARAIGARLDSRFDSLPRHGHLQTTIEGVEGVTMVRTEGLRSSDAMAVIGPRAAKDSVVAAIGSDVPILDEAEFEALRIDAGVPTFGRDVTEDNNPLEAGLWDSVSFEKGCYVGQEVVARLRNYDKVMKQLCRIELPASFPTGTKLLADGRDVGVLTSVAGPPHLEKHVALGYVQRRIVQNGTPMVLGTSDAKVLDVRVVKLAP